jgi:arylsulfatase A-like enzyme
MKQKLMLSCLLLTCTGFAAETPNIIFILADDIGYGDFSCYGATKVKTPNIDRLAASGLRFTDGHSAANVCTPSRFAFMTGQYAFRQPNTGIARGIEGLLIPEGRTTIAQVMKRAGYATGVVGKWHLGLGKTPTDYNGEIKPGPLEIGFDYAWLLPATGDRTPCVWVENRKVVNLDPADPITLDYSVQRGAPDSFINGIPRIGKQTGGKAALWKDDEISLVLANKGSAFIEKNKENPFFLYFATHNIHVPRVPNAQFRGKSECGTRGDAIVEFDWMVGQIIETVVRCGLREKTLIVLSSDNGGVLDTNGPDKVNSGTVETNNGHAFNGVLRGTKGSLYEGGTRVPFIVSWPKRVEPGVSDALVCQIDLMASLAALTGQKLAEQEGPDSVNVLPHLLGVKTENNIRDFLVEQNNTGSGLALRQGAWKYIPGNVLAMKRSSKREDQKKSVTGTKSDQPPVLGQLYNLTTDLCETNNLASVNPDRVKEMSLALKRISTSKNNN